MILELPFEIFFFNSFVYKTKNPKRNLSFPRDMHYYPLYPSITQVSKKLPQATPTTRNWAGSPDLVALLSLLPHQTVSPTPSFFFILTLEFSKTCGPYSLSTSLSRTSYSIWYQMTLTLLFLVFVSTILNFTCPFWKIFLLAFITLNVTTIQDLCEAHVLYEASTYTTE